MNSLNINQNIRRLASEVFDAVEWKEIQDMARTVAESEERKLVVLRRLRHLVPTRPKRPLYYVNYDLKDLPRKSRFVVEQMGSYLDLLVKELRYELEGRYCEEPLGRNILAIMKYVDGDMKVLLKTIETFNRIAYVPAKHIYGPPDDPNHYFSFQEAVVIALVAVKLGEKLKQRSRYVQKLRQDLVLPAQKPLIGNWKRTDTDGKPFDFKRKLFESRKLGARQSRCSI